MFLRWRLRPFWIRMPAPLSVIGPGIITVARRATICHGGPDMAGTIESAEQSARILLPLAGDYAVTLFAVDPHLSWPVHVAGASP